MYNVLYVQQKCEGGNASPILLVGICKLFLENCHETSLIGYAGNLEWEIRSEWFPLSMYSLGS